MAHASVSLVSMPWHLLGSPCIQLGALEAVLHAGGVACRSHSFYLAFQDHLVRTSGRGTPSLSLEEYGEVSAHWGNLGLGDWLFAVPSLSGRSRADDDRYVALLRENGVPRALARRMRALRERVPAFLEACADEIQGGGARVVGFTAVYSQTWPSAALARVLKRRDPTLRVVLGGAGCEGPMGAALLRAFPEIDVVLRGEAEDVVVELMQSLLEGAPVPRRDGLCFREQGDVVEVAERAGVRTPLDELPVPVYDEYFERLARSSLAGRILPQVPFESSRGCWWGMKSHCTFCGLNGMDMRFRGKSPERVLAEVGTLAARHGVLDFTAVDNILDMRYFDTLLPRLAEHDYSVFYETKANLTEAQVAALGASGVRTIQPGIESLSTPVLRLMRKGVTGLQNVRLLRWCAQHGIRVIWNLLYGFPGEPRAEYERMARLLPSLFHLAPPTLSRLMVYRFSPYHDRPEEHGIRIGPPLPAYRHLYDVDEATLADLAQAFEYEHLDGRDPEDYVGPLREGVRAWNRSTGGLTQRSGPDFMIVTDTRTTEEPARYTLGASEAAAYRACHDGPGQERLEARLRALGHTDLRGGPLRDLLRDFLEARLVVEEDGRFLSLALPRVVRRLCTREPEGERRAAELAR